MIHQAPAWLAQADPNLALTFNRHRNVILHGHDLSGSLTHSYNFASRDDGFSPAELTEQLQFIYQSEGKAFKINLAFGIILQNRESLEFRYYHAHSNVDLFDRPVLVSNARDLDRLITKVTNLNVLEEVSVNRPDTKWRLVLVTNVKYSVYLTSFALG